MSGEAERRSGAALEPSTTAGYRLVAVFGNTDQENVALAALGALAWMRSRVAASGGVVAVDARGRFGVARTTETMPWSLACDGRDTESGY